MKNALTRLIRSLAMQAAAIAAIMSAPVAAAPAGGGGGGGPAVPAARTIHADVVAINQPLVYNRFGSTNPWGMIFALRDHVEGCARTPSGGVESPEKCKPGKAMLKTSYRPRPLVLRINEGDRLVIHFQNLLMPYTPPAGGGQNPEEAGGGGAGGEQPEAITIPDPPNDPATRLAGISVVGLTTVGGTSARATGLYGIAPGESTEYQFIAGKPGSHFFASHAAVQGGEGDGGSLTHGLFGMVVVEPRGARVYRSQVTSQDMACLRNQAARGADCENTGAAGAVNYEARRAGRPVAAMHMPQGDGSLAIVHSDLTAIVVPPGVSGGAPCGPRDSRADKGKGSMDSWRRPAHCPYREFSIIFHDELKTVHAPTYAILNSPAAGASEAEKARHKQLVGARDGFAINYGASGMGTALISNRAGIGPARNCVDCAYEEFFLQSWANGDPALLPQYADDPSNVYHSYLGDPVEFHNVHAGPKETHVFHLHAHQWLSEEGKTASNYLDSQTIGPFQSFTYQIEYGGSGNRNLGPGDSIFHCHLYPHFAQGMWGLWRSHDVLEDGTRLLPDGGGLAAVSGTNLTEWQGPGTNPVTGSGELITHADERKTGGTPIPAIIPLPAMAPPPAPTYAANGMPGYPFYIPGKPGFRAPQPPLDMAADGGLPRHVTGPGLRKVFNEPMGDPATAAQLLARGLDEGDLTFKIEKVAIEILPQQGTPLERAAMAFHSQRATPEGFMLNGRKPAPGSPFANPCPTNAPDVQYNASVIETNLLVNRYGWHDPQARINVLDADLDKFQWNVQRSKRTAQAADPFFFRVHSNDCVTFRHTNRTSGKTGRDAYQVSAPTDIIGQHIHLVKFDVTSSDGSANGFNYEDGTLSPDIIEELIHASSAAAGGSVTGVNGQPATLSLPANPEERFQATYQRWWADPRLDAQGKDQTLGTVFTHDHFAPSNIQQHGFYNALIVEPKGSVWRHPDGTRMPKIRNGLGAAIGTQAIIASGTARHVPESLTGKRREFVMAVADFALLYDGSGASPVHVIDDYTVLHPAHDRVTFAANGRPIAPPQRPEAISVDHHDPFLFNYKLEPMPLRMGDYSDRWMQYAGQRGDAGYAFASGAHRQANQTQASLFSQPGYSLGDLACKKRTGGRVDLNAIDQRCNHADGDPSTEIFEAFVGDKAIMRVIQGAQEVQHVFEVNGLSWRRQPGDPDSPIVPAQEIGISEHFEMDLSIPLGSGTYFPSQPVDLRYSAGTVDALWNGAWGLIRTYPDKQRALDPGASDYWSNREKVEGSSLAALVMPRAACRLASVDGKRMRGCSSDGKRAGRDSDRVANPHGTMAIMQGKLVPDFTAFSGMAGGFTLRKFCVSTVQSDVVYNAREGIRDPKGLTYVLTGTASTRVTAADRSDLEMNGPRLQCQPVAQGSAKQPLVLRVNDGDFALIEFDTTIPASGPARSDEGNSVLPPIAPSSSLSSPSGHEISDRTLADRLLPSGNVSLVPQLVANNLRSSPGTSIGLNDSLLPGQPGVGHDGYPTVGQSRSMLWYAGIYSTARGKKPKAGFKAFRRFGTQTGMVAGLTSLGDPIKHATMGLVGALVIEPEGATWDVDANDVTQARVSLNGKTHREAVLVYQDGLNLKIDAAQHGGKGGDLAGADLVGQKSIPDCQVCDDTYDSGDSAVNYRTEPFWARVNAAWKDGKPNEETGKDQLVDLNGISIPADIWFRPVAGNGAGKAIETPVISAREGEKLVIHAVHPGGRARQRAMVTMGHSYLDQSVSHFGSPSSSLLAPRKAITAVIDSVRPGCWLWRDGPAQFVGGGVWGMIVARPQSAAGDGMAATVENTCTVP
ncbi:MAG: hypothetical protein ACKOPO_10915 [Novosphingobium sp.]